MKSERLSQEMFSGDRSIGLVPEGVSMQSRFLLGALGMVPVLFLCGPVSPQGLRAQLPESPLAPFGQQPAARAQSPFATSGPRDGLTAQIQAQLELLEVQKRQLAEQGEERVQELEELATEQMEQVKRDAERQIDQLKREAKRQIAQVKRHVQRQTALLEAQKRLVAAQGGRSTAVGFGQTSTDSFTPQTTKMKPQTVVIEVQVAEVLPKKDTGKADATDKDLDVRGFNGPVAQVEAKLRALQEKGLLGSVRRLQLTGTEGQPSSVTLGEQKPVTTGVSTTPRGVVSRSISYRMVGTQLKATAHVGAENQIEIDLDLNDARMVPNESIALGKDEAGKPVYATEFITSRFTNKLGVVPGQAVAAEGVQTTTKAGKGQTLVIVTAKVLDPNVRPPMDDSAPTRPQRRTPRFEPSGPNSPRP
jgi:hypothetical protein